MTTIAAAVAGLTLLYIGSGLLIRGAAALAELTGVSRLAIGLTVVAFGTSTPELVVSLDAALSGATDISLGNIVGSCIANVTLILGLAALIHPLTVQAKVVRVDAPLMVLATLLLVAIMADGRASPVEGYLLLAGLVAYTGFTFWEAGRESSEVQDEFASAAPVVRAGPAISVLHVLVGLGMLLAGGHFVVTAAISVTTLLGVSEAVVGLTIVAVGTSLPETATSIQAALRGQSDIAIGNVLGSNLFNILGIMGITSSLLPLQVGAITSLDLGTMVGVSALLAALLFFRSGLGRAEGGILLACYVLYTGWLIAA